MKAFNAIIANCSPQTFCVLGVKSVKSVLLHTHLFHGCVKLSVRKRIIEFGFLKLYIEFRKDGIGKYFKTKI